MSALDDKLAAVGLRVLGGFHPDTDEGLGQTVLMIGPDGAAFWPILQRTPEWLAGADDPVDRYSTRVLGDIAAAFDAKARFPFGGPPYQPFFSWALRSGQAWASPVSLLVHAEQGLFVSYRGALLLAAHVPLPPTTARPCDTCQQPCLTSCPVGALGAAGYDVPSCHSYLDTAPGAACMSQGCQVRLACPVGADLRRAEQSAYHMQRFHR
jgi:epoxyqueuosine reductase